MTSKQNTVAVLLVAVCFGCGAPLSESGKNRGDPSGGTTSESSEPEGSVTGGPVNLAGVFNARHLGTLPAADSRLRDHILIRSGDLSELSESDCSVLETLNVRTVIDLRDEPDLSDRPDVRCAGGQTNAVNIVLPKLLPPSSENYLNTLTAAEPRLAELFSVLTAPGSTLIHCVIGRDRATLITALVLMAVGVDSSTVLADATTNQDPSITVDSSWFDGVLSRLEEAGGIESYLLQHGVTSAQLLALREKLTERPQ